MARTSSRARSHDPSYIDQPWFPQAETFGLTLRSARESAGFTMRETAELLGVRSHNLVWDWEWANVLPSQNIAQRYSQVFNLGTAFFTEWKYLRDRIAAWTHQMRSLASTRNRSMLNLHDQGESRIFDDAPIGWSQEWWDPIQVEEYLRRSWTPSYDIYWNEPVMFDNDVTWTRTFNPDMLVIEEFEEFPMDSAPLRPQAPHLREWTPRRHPGVQAKDSAEYEAWQAWFEEEHAAAIAEAKAHASLRRAEEQNRKERMARIAAREARKAHTMAARRVVIEEVPDEPEETPKTPNRGGLPKGTVLDPDALHWRVFRYVIEQKEQGAIADEVARALDVRSLQVAAALSHHHKAGDLFRLRDVKRRAASGRLARVYVGADFVQDRPIYPYGREGQKQATQEAKKVKKRVRLDSSRNARRFLSDDLHREVEQYHFSLEADGNEPTITLSEAQTMAPEFEVPWTSEQRDVLSAYWQGINDRDMVLVEFLFNNIDRFKE